MEVEIFKANEEISKNVGIIAEDFCFPYGAYNKNIINYLDRLNVYKRLYTSDGRRKIAKNNATIYGRIGIENSDSLEIFEKSYKVNITFIIRFLDVLTELGNLEISKSQELINMVSHENLELKLCWSHDVSEKR